ncbi:MAG: hypothetical protein DMG88_19665, partial [Acidobacteria bacterium]
AISNAGNRTITLSGSGSTLTFGGTMTNTSSAIQTTTVDGAGNTLVLGGYALSSNATSRIDIINGSGNVNITGAITNGGTATASGLTYSGTGTDFNSAASWGGTAPGAADAAVFNTAEVTNPNLSASITIQGLNFSTTASSGYDLTSSSASIKLTLTNTGTGATSAINAELWRSGYSGRCFDNFFRQRNA